MTNPLAPTSPIKLTIFLTRKPHLSESDFHAHWANHHAKLVTPWLQKHGVIKYSQFHTPSWTQRKAQENITSIPASRYASYDGFVELIMRDERCFDEARKDPYYEEFVKEDEEKFIDMSKSLVVFGWEEVYLPLQDGEGASGV